MYSPEKIKWIKNIKKNKGDGWAYADVKCGSTFLLNWPTSKKGSASTPNVGDIIVLFQKPVKINGFRNNTVFFTHLVSPVSDIIYEDEIHPNHLWCRKVKLIAKATPIDSIPNPGHYNFFKPNRGLTNPIANLGNRVGFSKNKMCEDIWELFNEHFCSEIDTEIIDELSSNLNFGEIEGDKIIKKHILREISRRNSKIVQRAKEEALKKNKGRLKCESCNFDFVKKYGILGLKFIECHHKEHISSGIRITKIDDLALVCSNCHRMLHRKRKNGEYHTVESLIRVINQHL